MGDKLNQSWWWFFSYDTKSKSKKSKNKQVELYQTKKLLHSKGNHRQNEKELNKWEKNNCKWFIWQGANIQNI